MNKMSGAIFLGINEAWMASNSPYRWSVDYLTEKVTNPHARSTLREIAEHGFDTIDLNDPEQFDSDARKEILSLLSKNLVADAEDRLPSDLNGRKEYLEVLGELAERAGRASGQGGS